MNNKNKIIKKKKMAKLTSQGRQDVFRGRPRDVILSCLVVTNSYWQLCGQYLIILITSKEHLYRTLEKERERVNNKEKNCEKNSKSTSILLLC